MAHNQQFYDIVETVIAENIEQHSLIENDETIKLAHTEEMEEDFKSGEYTLRDLKSNLETSLITNQEYAEEQYGVDEETFNKFVLIAKELGWDLKKDLLERAEDIQIYDMNLEELVEMAITEWMIFGEGVDYDKLGSFIDDDRVWSSLLQWDMAEINNVGYVYTSL